MSLDNPSSMQRYISSEKRKERRAMRGQQVQYMPLKAFAFRFRGHSQMTSAERGREGGYPNTDAVREVA